MQQYDIYTPDSVIAGAVPFGKEDPREVAYNNAAYALDRDDVHLIHSVEGKYVYFIAANSTDFSGHPNAATPLSAALPGMKGHQGNGAYVSISGSAYAVIIKRDQDMVSYVGDKQSVDAFITANGMPTINTIESSVMPWEGYRLGGLRRAARTSWVSAISGIALAVVAAVFWFIFALKAVNYDETIVSSQAAFDRSLQESINKLSDFSLHPLQKSLEEMQRITSLATATGGWVKRYEVENGQDSWVVELPRWVTGDYIDKFGSNLKVTRPSDSEYILVEKEPAARKTRKR